MPHKEEYVKEKQAKPDSIALQCLSRPMILLAAIQAEKLFTNCFSHAFILSPHFNSSLRILTLRGFEQLSKETLMQILFSCKELGHLDLSYCKQVDNEIVANIGEFFKKKMVSLQLRSCHKVTDEGIIDMCENFSGAKEIRRVASFEDGGGKEPENDFQRYKPLNKCDLTATLKHLNLGDIKNITNRSMKSISVNLMLNLTELCIVSRFH